ncbi:MAG: pyruvate ferredoxin oxidoreductase [Deltaproteobacteria bacterium]|nr:pyruvate ferredoxin oxidoreductase [Deltaproteobacteria bacterium]MBW1936576.1 pyruvate ferredoxin oxidoreductase [Deltaproteobacteria bacterium]MBW1977736.1 pyruvate ferredoxin oxidoreductase [Deltaproteobacteria bacterium]MBW2043450.1 pyruvate ferredoxin oxidoreductase [Deltaproteobacteria bacterium]MBW2299430.1 pyruvate ferredoxin oxidoreductase [Deltaproteobacteria bacterium]
MKQLMTGNEAAALAAKMAKPQVVAAYPITPQTSIAEKLASYVARGELASRYIKVESETSALAACMGGSLAGARVFTATSSQGLALMHELLHWASGARLPVIIVDVNRSMAAPWSLGVDHNDSLSQRDTGCIQIYCETAQEALDNVLIAFKLAEKVLLPTMVCLDGFYLSHYSEPVDIPEQADVDRFLPRRKAKYRMDPNDPFTFGGGVSPQVLFGLRKRIQSDMDSALDCFRQICTQFFRYFKRRYRAVESFEIKGKDIALVTNGTLSGTVRAFVEQNGKEKGVGLVKMRLFRPFPKGEFKKAIKGLKKLVVIDRNLSPGSGGIFSQEIRSAIYGIEAALPIVSVIGGLGGVDVSIEDLDRLVDRIREGGDLQDETIWMEA